MSGFEFGILSLKVGRILVSDRKREHWTYEIAKGCGINRGSAHRILHQFRREGWLADETVQLSDDNKTLKVLFRMTDAGVEAITRALAPFQISAGSSLDLSTAAST